jgi:glycosyltransferase involved in cell wall biosynthesis
MEGNGKTVCMISCLHPLKDDRIYWKEAISLQKHGYKVIHIGVSDNAYDEITEHGIRLISLKRKQYFINPYVDKLYRTITFKPSIYKDILKTAREVNADVYHFHDFQINRIGKKLKALPQNPKVIYDVHEPYPITYSSTTSKNPIIVLFWKFYGLYVRCLEFKMSSNYDLIITTEENVQMNFNTKLKKMPVEIIYNFIDIIPKSTTKPKLYDFIYCGGIRKRRGIYEILNAINILKNKGIKSKTLLIGNIHDKGLDDEINNFIHENNLHDNIVLKQAVPYDRIRDYYEVSRVGLAVFNDVQVNRIIMPIKIFEYIVFGLPVITSNFGHMQRITVQNNTGILIETSNTIDLAEKMEKFLIDYTFYSDLANNCRKTASLYQWPIMENKLIEIYSRLMSRNHG